MPDMLKLARNPLSDLKVFVAENGEMIECRFIICTSNRKESESNMGTSFLHIHYHRYKMKVRLSAQTFSISVAFLQKKTTTIQIFKEWMKQLSLSEWLTGYSIY